MSYCTEVKRELLQSCPQARHCRMAALAALVSVQGGLTEDPEGKVRFAVPSEGGADARKYFTSLLKTVNISLELSAGPETEESVQGKGRASRSTKYILRLPAAGDLIGKLSGLTVSDGQQPIVREDLLTRKCCLRSYLREMFLNIGSVSDPGKVYHLEFACSSEQQARQLMEVLRRLGRQPRLSRRKKYHVVYFKEAEEIVDVLNLMGAPESLMKMENSRIVKDIRNNLNRRVNCEAANIGKPVDAARRQIEDIRFLEKAGILKDLPKNLRIMAELRLEFPDISLQELGERMEPPIGKSGVNHRLRRISETADRVRSGG